MPEPLVLVGAGGLGRETVQLVHACNAVEHRWDLLGFVDDDPEARVGPVPLLGGVDELQSMPGVKVVLCTARPDRSWTRKLLARRLGLPIDRYATLVHPTASIGGSVLLGAGSIVLAGVVVTADATIGDHVALMPSCVLTHDDHIEAFATFGAGARLAGGVTVGQGAYVGSGALVREDCAIGAWSVLGMGSLLLDDLPEGEIWVGAPARFLRRVDLPPDVTA